jgi:hypothetical protein
MPAQAVLDNLDDGMTPDAVAKAHQIDVRLVMGVKPFAESQHLALSRTVRYQTRRQTIRSLFGLHRRARILHAEADLRHVCQ